MTQAQSLNKKNAEYLEDDFTLDCDQYVERSRLFNFKEKNLVENGNLTILCKITFCSSSVTNKFSSNMGKCQPKCELDTHFKTLVGNNKFSDVMLLVDDQEIPAHKAILAARSVVFAAMFEHDMEENKTDRVVITDMSCEVLKTLLDFIYTGKVLNLNEMADVLLPAADKYALDELKEACIIELCHNLSVETVSEMLILSDVHGMKRSKTIALNFIKSHANDVIATQGWCNMIKSHPYLIAEAFANIASQK